MNSDFELGPYQVRHGQHAQRLILVVVDTPDSVTGQLNLLHGTFFPTQLAAEAVS